MTRRELVLEWARLKIERDVVEPLRSHGRGRMPILSDREGVDATIELSFSSMIAAAGLMSQIHQGQLELLPSCSEADLLAAVKPLSGLTDATGLVLHSLLVPAEKLTASFESHLRFGHQIHHEVFMALQIERNAAAFREVTIPTDVRGWMRDSA